MILSLILAPLLYMGSDSSEIPEVESTGAKWLLRGTAKDPVQLAKDAGWTAMRLRVWNAPTDGFCDKAHTLAMAKRIHDAGLKLMIDFHYSDWWADPAKQNKPAAWKDLSMDALTGAVTDYTSEVIGALVKQGTPPDVVQCGNEVTNGMLWPEGRLNINLDGWDNFIRLSNAAIGATKAACPKAKIMVHIDQGGRNSVSRFWFENYFKRGGQADILGLSYYPFWHGSLAELEQNLRYLATTYKKPILIAETAYPHLGWNDKTRAYDENAVPIPEYKATPAGQAAYTSKLIQIVRRVPNGLGAGVLWWAPHWIGSKGRGGGWERYTLFDNKTGDALPAVEALGTK